MDQEIDSLSLKIGVDINKEELKNLSKFATVITRLKNSIKSLDLQKLNEIKVPKGIKNFNIVTQSFKNIEQQKVENTKQLNMGSEIQKATTYVSKMNTLNKESLKMTDTTQKMKLQFKGFGDLATKFLSMGGKKKQTPLDKLKKSLGRIKLIAAIKAIRGAINFLVSGLNQGVTSLAVFDKEFNKTISGIKTVLTKQFSSLALIFRPFIDTIEPLLNRMTVAMSNVANMISQAYAKMQGLTKYTKINTKYAEDYAKSMQKAAAFSFDTFNTLNGQDSPYETANVDEDNTSDSIANFEKVSSIIKTIQGTINAIWNLIEPIVSEVFKLLDYLSPVINELLNVINQIVEAISPILSGIFELINPLIEAIADILAPIIKIISTSLTPVLKIVDFVIKRVVDVLKPEMDAISDIIKALRTFILPIEAIVKTIADYITDIVGFVEAIFSFDTDRIAKAWGKIWEDLRKNAFGFAKNIARAADTLINGIIDAINNAIFGGLNAIGEKLGWGKMGILWGRSNLESLIPSFANGGLVGELWQMNEYGVPEMLYNANNSGNNTSVINQAQLSLAFENAIYNTGLLDAIENAGIIRIDGRDIAQSRNFKDELNRTNPNLRLR